MGSSPPPNSSLIARRTICPPYFHPSRIDESGPLTPIPRTEPRVGFGRIASIRLWMRISRLTQVVVMPTRSCSKMFPVGWRSIWICTLAMGSTTTRTTSAWRRQSVSIYRNSYVIRLYLDKKVLLKHAILIFFSLSHLFLLNQSKRPTVSSRIIGHTTTTSHISRMKSL